MTNDKNGHIEAALQILASVGLPRAQQNERSALCLLALLNLTPGKVWANAENPLIGITPIMDWAREHYDKDGLDHRSGQDLAGEWGETVGD